MIENLLSQYSSFFITGGCLCLCLVLAPLAFFLYYKNKQKISASQAWPATNGQIKAAQVIEDSNPEGSTYAADIQYTYQIGGQEYIGKNIAIGGEGSSLSAKTVKDQVARYPVGKQVTVYYNPARPEEAALERRISGGNCFLVVAILLLAVAACMVASLLYLAMEEL